MIRQSAIYTIFGNISHEISHYIPLQTIKKFPLLFLMLCVRITEVSTRQATGPCRSRRALRREKGQLGQRFFGTRNIVAVYLYDVVPQFVS